MNLAAPSEIYQHTCRDRSDLPSFKVRLETRPTAIFKVGKTAAMVAVLEVVLPFVSGWLLMKALGRSSVESLFVATALVALSTASGLSKSFRPEFVILKLRPQWKRSSEIYSRWRYQWEQR